MLKVWQSLRPSAALRVTGGVVILSRSPDSERSEED